MATFAKGAFFEELSREKGLQSTERGDVVNGAKQHTEPTQCASVVTVCGCAPLQPIFGIMFGGRPAANRASVPRIAGSKQPQIQATAGAAGAVGR
jgi:hypothetical protein